MNISGHKNRKIHYAVAPMALDDTWLAACGIRCPIAGVEAEGTTVPKPAESPVGWGVGCPQCLESQVYKEDLLQFEIGFDRDSDAWIEQWDKRKPK